MLLTAAAVACSTLASTSPDHAPARGAQHVRVGVAEAQVDAALRRSRTDAFANFLVARA